MQVYQDRLLIGFQHIFLIASGSLERGNGTQSVRRQVLNVRHSGASRNPVHRILNDIDDVSHEGTRHTKGSIATETPACAFSLFHFTHFGYMGKILRILFFSFFPKIVTIPTWKVPNRKNSGPYKRLLRNTEYDKSPPQIASPTSRSRRSLLHGRIRSR